MSIQRNPTSESVTCLRHFRTPTVCICEVVVEEGVEFPLHAHDEYLVRLILAGSCSETVGNRTIEHTLSNVMCSHPDDAHGVRVHGRTLRYFSVEFAPAWIERLRAYSLSVPHTTRIQDEEAIRISLRLYRELDAIDDVSELAVEGMASELMAALSRCRTPTKRRLGPRWLRPATDALNERFQSPPTISDLAASAGVHPGHLTRAFREHHGCTIGEYVRRLRVDYVRRCLSATDTALVDIAAAAGFSDQSHLCRVFKKMVGVSPARYRAEVRL